MTGKKRVLRRILSGVLSVGFVLAISPSAVVSAAAEELPPVLLSTGQALSKMGRFIGGRLMDTVDQLSSQNLQSVTSLAQAFTPAGETPSPADAQVSPAAVSGDFSYTVLDDGTAEITRYNGSAAHVAIPSEIDGYRVTSIDLGGIYSKFYFTSMEIPDSVTSISEGTFRKSLTLEEITVDDRNPVYADLDGVLFSKDLTVLHRYPQGKKGERYVIPESVTSIERDAFSECDFLTDVEVPGSMTTIGDEAFQYCDSLKRVVIQDGVTSIGTAAFLGCSNLTDVTIPESVTRIEYAAFFDCGSLKNIKLPDGITYMGDQVFTYCYSLTHIAIPEGLTYIHFDTFYGCKSLRSVAIPATVKKIFSNAFTGCSALTDVYYGGTAEDWENIIIDENNKGLFRATIHYSDGALGVGGALTSGEAQISVFDRAGLEDSGILYSAKLKGVTLTSGGESQQFDETIVLSSEYSGRTAVFSLDGYQDYIVPPEVLSSWYTKGGASVKNIYLEQSRRDGKPYISTVFARDADDEDGAYVELQSESMTASKGVAYDLILSAGQAGGSGATYYLSQDDATRISSSTGVFSGEVLADTFLPGRDVYAYVTTASGVTSEPVKLKLTVTDAELPNGSISLLGEDGFKIKFSENTPLVGGAEIKMDGFNFPVGVKVEGNHIRISFGVDIFSNGNNEPKTESGWEHFKKTVCTINENITDANEKLREFKKFYKTFAPNQGYPNKSKNFDVSFLGYAEGTIVNGSPIFTDFSGELTTKFLFKYTQQGTIWFIPVYGSIGAGGEAAVEAQAVRALPDKKMPYDFGFKLKLKPELDLGIGVGLKGAISGGLYGQGNLNFENDFSIQHTLVEIGGEIGIEGEFYIFNGKKEILNETIKLWDRFYGSAKKFGASAIDDAAQDDAPQYQTVTEVMPRSYLDEMSGWLDRRPLRRSPYAVADGLQIRELQTSVFKNSQTELIALDDGRMMMAWIEDDPQRDTYNRLRLVYSVWENGAWSNPQAVSDDGTNDGYPTLATDGKNIFIAWQNINRAITEADADSIDAVVQGSEICIAQYDSESGSFNNVKTLTNNKVYDYSPVLSVDDGVAVLYWLHNAANDLTQSSSNTIYFYSSERGSSVPVLSRANYILAMDCAIVDGEPQLAYTMDEDGDLSTTNDVCAFTLIDGEQVRCTPQSQEDVSADFAVAYGMLDGAETLFFADAEDIYYLDDGAVKTVFQSARAINGDLQILDNGANTSLMWTEASEAGTELWLCTYSGGAWSEPVQLSNTGALLHDISAVYCDGIVYGVFDRTARTLENGTYVNGTTDLCFMTLSDFTNLEASFAPMSESVFVVGENVAIPIYLKNNGTRTIDTVTITLDGFGLKYSVEKEVHLASGAETVVGVEYPVPLDFARTCLKLHVDADTSDLNTEDNSDAWEVGYADISIGDMTIEEVGEYFILTAVLSNDNQTPAGPVNVQVRSGSRDGEVLESIEVGMMQPGEFRSIQYMVNRDAVKYDSENLSQLYFVAEIETEATLAAKSGEAQELITADNALGAVLQYTDEDPDPQVSLGDLDQDGRITATDARFALQLSDGSQEITEELKLAADLDGDGLVTAIDARWILQISTGERELPDDDDDKDEK